MFRPTDRQVTFGELQPRLSPRVRARLERSWAGGFRRQVLPLLLEAETDFADLYADSNGRPNWSVARLLGLTLLQEWFDFPDQQALDAMSFDVRWQFALGLEPGNRKGTIGASPHPNHGLQRIKCPHTWLRR